MEYKKEQTGKIRQIRSLKTSNGYELCFGFGEYQKEDFCIKIQGNKFYKTFKWFRYDFWKFVNDGLSAAPKEVKITISKEEGKFDNTNSKIWAFGNKGKIEFLDGDIVFNSLTGLTSSNYVTVLVQLNKGEITSGERINKDFSYYQDMAFKGSSYDKNYKKNTSSKDRQRISRLAIQFIIILLPECLELLQLFLQIRRLKVDTKGRF